MRSLTESVQRWQATISRASNLESLREAVKVPPEKSICTLGLRSVCWKAFLLFRDTDQEKWGGRLADSRAAYDSMRQHFMKYIDHPEELAEASDPLNDDENSPWTTLRNDEELRVEIFQDVERCMPDEPYFRQEDTQLMLANILFVYCKINQDIGYRQGMHEILAPILWVIEQDAIANSLPSDGSKPLMDDILDAKHIEHDSFTLFSLVMRTAKSFYELGEPEGSRAASSGQQPSAAPIVERSKQIHEVMLASVDPELASHLTQIEVLPQIFLIRWVRLLFGREFPFEDLLPLWDNLFAQDPDLDLIDLICVSMLLRLRWQLLEADYSVALMLLLKYPYPDPPHGPQTFIEDALMLRKNLNTSTGTKIITKYSGRPPNDSTPGSFPPTPNYTSTADRRIRRRRSPLPSPSTFIRQQGGVEAILQGAAKGVFERSERLGINQIMRDGFGELKKNMQGLPSPALSRRTSENGKWKIDDRRPSTSAVKALQALEARNRKLGELLGEVADDLYKLAEAPGAQDQSAEAVSVAIRRMSLLRGCLNDSSQPIPSFTPATSSPTVASTAVPSTQLSTASTMVVEPEFDTNEQLQDPNSFDLGDFDNDDDTPLSPVTPQATPHVTPHVRNARKPSFTPTPMASSKPQTQADSPSSPPKEEPPSTETHAQPRPQTIIPTRSSLAQSSFAWMLEPGDSLSPSKSAAFSSPSASSGRKPTPRHAREKSAFLFGDDEGVDASKSGGADPLQAFSLDEMKK